MKELLQLFGAFFRVGLFTFGGGYSMLPMLEREVVTAHGWATREELLDYFAIGQCAPGVIAVNTATLIGYKLRKFWGAFFASLGVVLPSLIIIVLIAALLSNFTDIPEVQKAFIGIRVAVAALIVSTVIRLLKINVLRHDAREKKPLTTLFKSSWPSLLLCAAAFVLVAIFGASPIYVIVGSALAGLFLLERGKRT